jgi:ABC-2 type transport system ATP-binding protein
MIAEPVQAIHVQGLQKSYKEVQVLRGVDFDVARGSIFALLGSNGAGKTTIVNILSTLLKADAGTASVNGFDVAMQAADVRQSISLTGQFAAVDEILSGRENLVLVARLRHLRDPGAQVPAGASRRSSRPTTGQQATASAARSRSRATPPWWGPGTTTAVRAPLTSSRALAPAGASRPT